MNKYIIGLIFLLISLVSCGSKGSSDVNNGGNLTGNQSESPSIQMTEPVRSEGSGENSF